MNTSRLLILVVCSLACASVARAAPPSEETRACVAASTQGQTDRDDGRLLAARNELRACARASCPAIVAKKCGDWLAELEPRIPSVVPRVIETGEGDVTDATVTIDQKLVALDGREVWVDPGPHEVVVETAGRSPVRRTFLVAERERARLLTIELPALASTGPVLARAPEGGLTPPVAETTSSAEGDQPEARPNEPRAAPAPVPRTFTVPVGAWVLAGVGVAGGVGFAVLGTLAQNDEHRLDHACAPSCDPKQAEPGERKALLADISLGVGAAALLGAGAWTLSRWLRRDREHTTTVALWPTRDGVQATVAARY